jgi:uncharacterized oxidoreductase
MRTSGNTILITGGGSGIGRALAHRFHDLGNRVIVAARRQEPLEETAAGRDGIATALLDVADGDAIAPFAERLIAAHPALNVVIHNAGIMRCEDMATRRDLADMEAMIATNLLGPIRLTDALIDHLSAQPDAAIVTVSSGLAFVPLTQFPTYCATKAAIHSYSITLRERLRGQVEVIELAPPGVQTDLTPGQSSFEGYMSLADFTDKAMAAFESRPTPEEIPVGRAKMLRMAERDGRFEEARAQVNAARPK